MKNALIYSFKIWLTSSLLTIGITSFLFYKTTYPSLAVFGATSWIPVMITDYWEHFGPGFVVLWVIMAAVIQTINLMHSSFLKKRVNLFLLADGLMIIWLTVFGVLFREHNYFLPGSFVWMVFTLSMAFSVRIYRFNDPMVLNNGVPEL